MLLELSDLLWRGLALLWLAIAPYAGPIDVAPPGATTSATLRLVGAALVLAIGAFGLSRLWRVSRPGAALGGLALGASLVLGAFFNGDRGPLARGFFWIAPLVWGAIALTLAGPVADLTAKLQNRPAPVLKERSGWVLAVALFAGLSVATSWRRVGSSSALLRAALRANPGNESAAMRLSAILEKEGASLEAGEVRRACAEANPDACDCAISSVEGLLEQQAHAAAFALLKPLGKTCQEKPGVYGVLAETLAVGGFMPQATQAADIALAGSRRDRHALYAKARILLFAADLPGARRFADEALALGRGPLAGALLATILVRQGDFEAGKQAAEQVLRDSPKNVEAVYSLALVAYAQQRYSDARAAWLRMVTLDPKNLDARYHLGALAHEQGADAEAVQRLRDLEQVAPPSNPRVIGLKKLVEP